MAETSYFWSGTVTGDANNAEYNHLEYTKVYNKFLASDGVGYVIPGYANSLNVQASSPAAASVDVHTGAAMVQGFLYENDALNTLAVPANASGNPRIDRIVLRINFAAQTVRVALVQGSAAATPSLPTLTTVYGTTWEVSLAYIWVANGFSTITEADIHDEREFTLSASADQKSSGRKNLVRGSEFVVPTINPFTGGADISGTWFNLQVAAATVSFTTKPTQQARGAALKIASGATASEIQQAINVNESTVYTLHSLVMPEAGAAGLVIEIYDKIGAAVIISRTMRRTGSWLAEKIRFTTPAACSQIILRIVGVANQTIDIGQQVLTEGYRAGNFEPVHEYIALPQEEIGTNYNFTAYSSTLTSVDLFSAAWSTTFTTLASRLEILAIDVLLGANDSGSAAGNVQVAVLGASETSAGNSGVRIDLSGETNDKKRYNNGMVPVQGYSGSPKTATLLQSFLVSVTASGAGTCDVLIAIRGVWI